MDRPEAERKIMEHLHEIDKIMHDYGTVSGYISLCICDGYLNFNNRYWHSNGDYPDGQDIGCPLDKGEYSKYKEQNNETL